MTKYKLYTFSGVMYVVPLDKYEYIDDIAESYFEDYCAGLLTTHELDSFVEECIIDNGGKRFDIWCDDYYVIMNKGDYSFDDVLEIPLIGDSLILIKPLHQVQKTAQYGWIKQYISPPFKIPKIILGKFLEGAFQVELVGQVSRNIIGSIDIYEFMVL